jgi:TAG lipase/lysophosphatidylethanolamine acyltransferase
MDYKKQGNVTIAPHISSADFYTLFSSPTANSLYYWILRGEQATWPFLTLIQSRTSIELSLDKELNKVRNDRERFAFKNQNKKLPRRALS